MRNRIRRSGAHLLLARNSLIVGVFWSSRLHEKLFVPFELDLLFSFQRPTRKIPAKVAHPSTANYLGLPGRPGSAESIETRSRVNSFFRDSFVGVSKHGTPEGVG